MTAPKILIHECADAPKGHRLIASFYVDGARLPVLFSGDDRDALIKRARDFWVDERAKVAKHQANRAAASARRRKDA